MRGLCLNINGCFSSAMLPEAHGAIVKEIATSNFELDSNIFSEEAAGKMAKMLFSLQQDAYIVYACVKSSDLNEAMWQWLHALNGFVRILNGNLFGMGITVSACNLTLFCKDSITNHEMQLLIEADYCMEFPQVLVDGYDRSLLSNVRVGYDRIVLIADSCVNVQIKAALERYIDIECGIKQVMHPMNTPHTGSRCFYTIAPAPAYNRTRDLKKALLKLCKQLVCERFGRPDNVNETVSRHEELLNDFVRERNTGNTAENFQPFYAIMPLVNEPECKYTRVSDIVDSFYGSEIKYQSILRQIILSRQSAIDMQSFLNLVHKCIAVILSSGNVLTSNGLLKCLDVVLVNDIKNATDAVKHENDSAGSKVVRVDAGSEKVKYPFFKPRTMEFYINIVVTKYAKMFVDNMVASNANACKSHVYKLWHTKFDSDVQPIFELKTHIPGGDLSAFERNNSDDINVLNAYKKYIEETLTNDRNLAVLFRKIGVRMSSSLSLTFDMAINQEIEEYVEELMSQNLVNVWKELVFRTGLLPQGTNVFGGIIESINKNRNVTIGAFAGAHEETRDTGELFDGTIQVVFIELDDERKVFAGIKTEGTMDSITLDNRKYILVDNNDMKAIELLEIKKYVPDAGRESVISVGVHRIGGTDGN